MSGSRFARGLIIGFGLAMWLLITLSHSDHIQLQARNDLADVTTLAQQGTRLDWLFEHYPLTLLEHQQANDVRRYGQYRRASHWLARLLPVDAFEARFLVADGEIRAALSADYYLQAANSTYLRNCLLLLLALGISWLSLYLRFRRSNEDLQQLVHAVKVLPSLVLPNRLSENRFPALANAIIEARDQVKKQINTLKQHHDLQVERVNTDPITRLPNRTAFNEELSTGKQNGRGFLLMLRASALGEINQRHGNAAGDVYLVSLTGMLNRLMQQFPQARIYRYTGSDLLMRLPDLSPQELNPLLPAMTQHLSDIAQQEQVASAGYIGITPFVPNSILSQLLIQLDTAVTIAESQSPNSSYCIDDSAFTLEMDCQRWEPILEDVIGHRRVEFSQQPILTVDGEKKLYHEVFVRFHNAQGQPLPTPTLFAMAARTGHTMALDKLIVDQIVRKLERSPMYGKPLGINLANHSVNQPEFVHWLEQKILNTPILQGKLVLELSEHSLELNPEPMRRFIENMHQIGIRVAIDRFGQGLTSFRALQAIRPDYIKLAPEFTKGIGADNNNRFFIKLLLDVAIRLEIKVIATHVETHEEQLTLQALRIDGLQGHLLEKPQPLKIGQRVPENDGV